MTCSSLPARPRCHRGATALALAAAAALSAGLAAAPAFADPPASSPRPMLRSDSARIDRAAEAQAATATPAPEQTRPEGGYVRIWKAGEEIYPYNFHLLADYRQYGLPRPPSGQAYVQLGNQVLRVRTDDWRVTASVGRTFVLLGHVKRAPAADRTHPANPPLLEASM